MEQTKFTYFAILISVLITFFTLWDLIFAFIMVVFYNSIGVERNFCRVINNNEGCSVISAINGNRWNISPCIFEGLESNDQVLVCSYHDRDQMPLPNNYYDEDSSLTIYKIFNMMFIWIFFIGFVFLLNRMSYYYKMTIRNSGNDNRDSITPMNDTLT